MHYILICKYLQIYLEILVAIGAQRPLLVQIILICSANRGIAPIPLQFLLNLILFAV